MNTYNFNYYCRTQKVNKSGLAPIELSLIINKKRTYITLPYKTKPTDFAKAMQSKRNNEIKDFVGNMTNKLQNTVVTLLAHNVPLTIDTVKDALLNGYSTSYTIADLFREFYAILSSREDMTLNNLRKYEMAKDLFLEVVEPTKQATEITNANILQYQAKVYNKYKEGTAASYMVKLKAFITFGVNNHRLTNNPFNGIKISAPKSEIELITRTEYSNLLNAKVDGTKLERTRDFFILMANCGLAFADLTQLTKEDIVKVGNYYTITKDRQKTKVTYNAIILQDGVNILEKYNYDISPLKLSNSITNRYAKELQTIAKISSVDSLHTHLMRHYYITSLIRCGIDLAVVKKCAGHSNIKTTLQYVHLQTEDIVESVSKHI